MNFAIQYPAPAKRGSSVRWKYHLKDRLTALYPSRAEAIAATHNIPVEEDIRHHGFHVIAPDGSAETIKNQTNGTQIKCSNRRRGRPARRRPVARD